MKRALKAACMLGVLAVGAGAFAQAQDREQQRESAEEERKGEATATQRPQSAQEAMRGWPDVSSRVGRTMIERYGEPDGITSTMLVWHDTGPFSRSIVYRDPVDHDFPKPHQDVLEQFISYSTPVDKFDELAEYDGSVIAERTKGELSARCDMEAMNLLALNLANDIVTEQKTVEEARQAYADTVQAYGRGERPVYTQRLTFEPPPAEVARDADRSVIQPGQEQEGQAKPEQGQTEQW